MPGRKWKRSSTPQRIPLYQIESWQDGAWRVVWWARGRSRADREVARRRRAGMSARAVKAKR